MIETPRELILAGRFASHTLTLVWLVICMGSVLMASQSYPDPRWAAGVSLILTVGGVVTLSSVFPSGFWSPAVLFFLVAGVFHVGLAPYVIFGWDPLLPRVDDYIWFAGPVGGRSFALVNVFLSFFVASSCFLGTSVSTAGRQRLPNVGADPGVDKSTERSRASMSTFGALALSGGVVYWFVTVFTAGGLGIFFGSYTSFLRQTAGGTLPVTYMVISLGLGLAVMGAERRLVKVSLALFGLFAFISFFLGLRGEVLFPAAVAASVLALRARMPRGVFVLVAVATALTLIDAAKAIRAAGFAAGVPVGAGFNPLSALAELGSSLRVVAHVVIWHDHQGEPLSYGATYAVSVVRLLESLFSPVGSPDAMSDFRLMNSEIMARSGAIGGSVVAEAFHNFGTFGVSIVGVLLGLLFGLFSAKTLSVFSTSIYVCIAVPLFNHVRNSFVPVLPFIFVSGLVVFSVYFLARRGPGVKNISDGRV